MDTLPDGKNNLLANAYPAFLIFTILFCTYLFFFNGIPTSDDEHLFISASQNWANFKSLTVPQLSGNPRLKGNYNHAGPLHPIAAAPLFEIIKNTNLGKAQVFFLASPLYTALTALIIFFFALHFKFEIKTAVSSALIFGLASIAWPYTQTFYREPLAMMLLTFAWFMFEISTSDSYSNQTKTIANILFVVCFIASLFVKLYIITIFPAFIYLIWKKQKQYKLVPISAILIILFYLFFSETLGWEPLINSRITLHSIKLFLTKYIPSLNIKRFSNAFFGSLISPSKGLFIYSPVTLLFLFSLKKVRSYLFDLFFIPLNALLGFIILQAIMYGENWWNISWSTRFLLPIVPLLIIAALPTIDKYLRKPFFLVLIISSILTQFGRILISDSTYLSTLYAQQSNPDLASTIWKFQHFPLLAHWQIVFQEKNLDLAFWRTYTTNPQSSIFTQILLLTLILLSVWSIKSPLKLSKITISIISLTLLLIPIQLLNTYKTDPFYTAQNQSLAQATEILNSHPKSNDIILIDSYLLPSWYYYLNFGSPSYPWYSLPTTSPNETNLNLFTYIENKIVNSNQVWVLTQNSSPNFSTNLANNLSLENIWQWNSENSTTIIFLFEPINKP